MKLEVAFEKAAGDFRLEVAFESDADFIVIHGPSGAGKSLTLKAIAGLMTPDAGRIEVGGRTFFDSSDGIDVPVRRRRVGYVAQDYALFPHMTVEGNVAFAVEKGLLRRVSREDREWVEQLLESFGLITLRGESVSNLSGGQRQRVALARALAARSEILLLDEPLSALDEPLRRQMRHELRNIQKHFQVQVVMVTHDVADVEALADDVVVIRSGRVERTWSLRQLCRRRKVARFISNHVPPTVA